MKKSFLLIGNLAVAGVMMLLLWGCMDPDTVEPNAKVSFSYLASNPETMEVIASGTQKDLLLDFTGSALYQLLEGAKKDEIRTWILTDPFSQHDEDLVQKQTTLVLNEMGVPLEIGETIEVAGKPAILSQIVSEDGVEQAVLDSNPVETVMPLEWKVTIMEIK